MLKFEKYHGLGNDFVIFDEKELEKNNIKIQAQDHINNTSGIIQASGNTDIHAKSLNNQQGQLLANDLFKYPAQSTAG